MLNDRSPFDNSMSATTPPSSQLTGTRFQLRRKLLKLRGAAFYITNEAGAIVLYADQKAFQWKDDIRVYTSEQQIYEVLRIASRSIIDFSAAFDVFDSQSNTKIGTFRRKGWKSLVRDEWQILDYMDREVGVILEDSSALAILRRTVELAALLIPQKYSMTINGQDVGHLKHVSNPFSTKIDMDLSADPSGILDRRMAMAAGVLISAVEGKQR